MYCNNTLEYSDVFKILINESISNNNYSEDYVKFFSGIGVKKLSMVLRECGLNCDEQVLVMKIIQMLGTLVVPTLLGNHMNEMTGLDYRDIETRNKYIDFIFKSLISQ